MLTLLFAQTSLIDQLDALAQARDVAGLTQYLADPAAKTEGGRNPFDLLRTGGGYAMGAMGWHARQLTPPAGNERFIVLSTPILEEDAGELLFRLDAAGKLTFVPERDDLGMQLDSHDFAVSFDLPGHSVKVTDALRCKWRGAAHDFFVFRMSPTLHVDSVTGPDGRPVPFDQAGGVTAIASRKDGVFRVQYAGTLQKPGFQRQIGPEEATLSGSMWYPMIARRPTTYQIAIHAKPEWYALAQGKRLDSVVNGGERVTTYRMDLPVCWFSATAGPYRRVSTKIGGIEFATISPRASEDDMRRQNENNAAIVDFYSKTFGRYPFDTWTTVDSTQFIEGVGALEAYSFATYLAGSVPAFDTHEPSHTWWGGILSNDYLESIWNESFADYSQVMYRIDQPIGNREERHRAFLTPGQYSPAFEQAPLAHSGQDVGPVATALGYVKGAYVLQALEDELGADAFIRCLRDWVRTNPPNHVPSWGDFEQVVDRLSGRDCTWFFDEWVRGVGLPDFRLADGAWAEGTFTGKVQFDGAPYRITLDAVLEYPSGRRAYARVQVDPAKGGTISIRTAERPAVVALDPFQKIAIRHPVGRVRRSTLSGFRAARTYVDAATPEYLRTMTASTSPGPPPADVTNCFLIGNPATMPALVPLCKRAGLRVSGNRLTYDGTTVGLNDGGALALVDLPDGRQAMIGLGQCTKRPEMGRARLVVFDGQGRMLRGQTDPADTGPLSIRLGAAPKVGGGK